ncbi:MAG: glycosyltransferase, partial [Bdellovibrionales bacterium]|nr:glycosyltransferase [Bdellovibrionales bacterium]
GMKILFLAPQPFFQERGTPIAVRLALQVLATRLQSKKAQSAIEQIDLLTYSEGSDVTLPGVTIYRTPDLKICKGIGPGISIKKLICDFFFLCKALSLVWQNRGSQYDLVHAVEESVFMACIIKFFFRIPFIYDMDSSMSLQITEKWPVLTPLLGIFEFFERIAVRQSMAVVPVCDALAVIAEKHGSPDTHILRDISLLNTESPAGSQKGLRAELGVPLNAKVVIYIGNLEHYQGIDLLIDSFALISASAPDAHLVIIGGSKEHIDLYRRKVSKLDCASKIHIAGTRPVEKMGEYLSAADIVTSPRTRGNNTPMKIYSYIHCGKPLLATNLPTHSQVLDNNVALLCEPTPEAFSKGLIRLLAD